MQCLCINTLVTLYCNCLAQCIRRQGMTRLVRGPARLRLFVAGCTCARITELNKETELDHSSYRSVQKLLEGSRGHKGNHRRGLTLRHRRGVVWRNIMQSNGSCTLYACCSKRHTKYTKFALAWTVLFIWHISSTDALSFVFFTTALLLLSVLSIFMLKHLLSR